MPSLTLSIAMCTYNGMPYLREQLDSIAGQSRLPDELVVCDDGSTDDTIVVLEEFAGRAPFPVRIVRNPENLGSTHNFEKAIGLCNSDIIALSDQDDIWLPSKLQSLISLLEESPQAGMAFSNGELIDEESKPIGISLWDLVMFRSEGEQDFRRHWETRALIRRNYVTGATLAFRSMFRELISPIPDGWVHDYWIACILSAVSDLVFIDEPRILYRMHHEQQIGFPEPSNRRLAFTKLTKSSKVLAAVLMLVYRVLLMEPMRIYRLIKDRSIVAGQLRHGLEEILDSEKRIQRAIEEHLLTSGLKPKAGGYYDCLNEAMEHHRIRLDMPKQLIRRLPIVYREMKSGRYERHSEGRRSAFRDIIG